MMKVIKRLAVFCGAAKGNSPQFIDAAQAFGEALCKRHIGLVFGGSKLGVMGVISDVMLNQGAEVIGVMPKFLFNKEIMRGDLTAAHLVESLHDRKVLMGDLADGFVMLPGGIGTLEEFFEIFSSAQLGFHRKPCGILNVDGYFDEMIAFLTKARDSGFIAPKMHQMMIVANTPEELLDAFFLYEAPSKSRWE